MGPLNDENEGRERMGRFITFVARLIAPQSNGLGGCLGGLLSFTQGCGLAIAPRTALLLQGDGVRSPFTGKRVTNLGNTSDNPVYFVSATASPSVCVAIQPLTFRQVKVQKNADSDMFNLNSWTALSGSTYYRDIDAGILSSASIPIY